MSVEQRATEADVTRLLGELDPLTMSRILAIGATREELEEAVLEAADEAGFGEEPRAPSSTRVANVRALLDEIAARDAESDVYVDYATD